MRDKASRRQEFIFNVDRLATYLIEKALEFIPTACKTVTTPVGVDYNGRSITKVGTFTGCVSVSAEQDTLGSVWCYYPTIVSVSLRRSEPPRQHRVSGGPLEQGMRRVLRDPVVGSLLIQSDDKSGEPILLHSMLPVSIRERHRAEETWVFLLDAQVCPPLYSVWVL